MPLTVGQVVALPELGLSVHTDGVGLDREVRWVAVSEHLDPTPWLAVGDLLLTTGLAFDADAEGAADFVARLADVGVAGIGFGTGPIRLPHRVVPAALVTAARAVGLPVFEVPEPVPFVALGKAVSRLLAAEEYAEAAAAFDSQRRLLSTALADDEQPATDSVVRVVARHVDGFALLVEPDSRVRAVYPAAAAARCGDFAAEIARIRPRGLRGSAALSSAEESVTILPVGVHSADAYLVVGSPRPVRPADRGVLQLAVSVLAWPGRGESVPSAWRSLFVRHVRSTGMDTALLADLGLGRIDPRRAVAVAVRTDEQAETAAAVRRIGSASVVLAPVADGWEGFAGIDDGGSLPTDLEVVSAMPGVFAVGVSSAADLRQGANVVASLTQAEHAARAGGLRRFDDGPVPSVVDLVDAARTQAWASQYLGSLRESDEAIDLMDTVQAWLASHGQVDAAAQHLGIHRHTVRHRLRRAEVLLGRSLDDPQVRADLWFALQAAEVGR